VMYASRMFLNSTSPSCTWCIRLYIRARSASRSLARRFFGDEKNFCQWKILKYFEIFEKNRQTV
jgi:hypothetical protein